MVSLDPVIIEVEARECDLCGQTTCAWHWTEAMEVMCDECWEAALDAHISESLPW